MRIMFRLCALAVLAMSSTAQAARSVLFVGNSFTFGALSPVQKWQPGSVTDLNGDGVGGVPALFKRFADESGGGFDVSLETAPGRSLQWHWDNRRNMFDRRWDGVVLQEYSTLDPDRPGDPAVLIAASAKLARLFRSHNPRVRIALVATWSRPDQTYPQNRHWSGQPIERMAIDIRRANDQAAAAAHIANIAPVGEAFNCAIKAGLADPDPYDGIAPGLIDLWAEDHYHASTAGYYLEALTIFTRFTGRDPRLLGRRESAARELSINPELAARLQHIAYDVVSRGRCRS